VPLVSSTGHGHASIKRVKYQEGKFALGSILCAVIPNDEKFVLAKYLHIYLHWNKEELLVSQMKGMANVSLPMNKIADVLVTIPSIKKQQAIIDLEKKLVTKELLVENLLCNQLAQIENLNQAILQEAVQGKLVKQDKKDEPASKLLQRIKSEKEKLGKKEKILPAIKAEEIPFEIPESWVWCRLGDVCSNISDIDHSMPKAVTNGGVKFLSAKDLLNNGTINYNHNIKYISEEDFLRLGRKIIPQRNDIIYSRIGAKLGKARIVHTDERFIVSYSCCTIRTLNPNIEFLNFLLDSGFVLKQASENTTMNSIPDLGIQKIKEFIIPLPPLPEQKCIVAEIEKQLAKTKQLKEHIIANQQATEQLLKALLHEAFEVA
jgi:type I restriction enzyme, S subunit